MSDSSEHRFMVGLFNAVCQIVAALLLGFSALCLILAPFQTAIPGVTLAALGLGGLAFTGCVLGPCFVLLAIESHLRKLSSRHLPGDGPLDNQL